MYKENVITGVQQILQKLFSFHKGYRIRSNRPFGQPFDPVNNEHTDKGFASLG
uniref:Uncharacterized protein n=1 Tax=Anguilla anguilla TaxID=7936 RepID=A0A0E9RZC4_ANGAN